MSKRLALSSRLAALIKTYKDFPKEGILFRDLLPVFEEPSVYSELIEEMASATVFKEVDAIIAIDARGFLLGSSLALKLGKPMVVARKPGKLPGDLISKSYDLEYGSNSLSIQKDSISSYESFIIVDDLLATGGTARSVSDIVNSVGKKIVALSVVIELSELNAKSSLDFPVFSQVLY